MPAGNPFIQMTPANVKAIYTETELCIKDAASIMGYSAQYFGVYLKENPILKKSIGRNRTKYDLVKIRNHYIKTRRVLDPLPIAGEPYPYEEEMLREEKEYEKQNVQNPVNVQKPVIKNKKIIKEEIKKKPTVKRKSDTTKKKVNNDEKPYVDIGYPYVFYNGTVCEILTNREKIKSLINNYRKYKGEPPIVMK